MSALILGGDNSQALILGGDNSQALILDIVIEIARKDILVWIRLALSDPDFSRWAFTPAGRAELLTMKCDIRHSFFDHPLQCPMDSTISYWYRCGQLHRDNDLPAVTGVNGLRCWYNRGDLHRDDDKPAIIRANGSRYWYSKDMLHRGDGLPAIIYADGAQRWYFHDRQLRATSDET